MPVAHAQNRQKLIQQIEGIRGSRVITYVTSDRVNAGAQISPDVIPRIYRHLEALGQVDRIDLFIYTRGGHTLTPVRLVSLIREYCREFNVLVPFRCHSAGTLVCLGADTIVMGKLGELGPVDPRVTNEFNPTDPQNPAAKVAISVEDVTAFIQLVKERIGVNGDATHSVMQTLTQHVHPLALGNVQRHHSLIRAMSKKLLSLRSGRVELKKERTESIVDYLTGRISAHDYAINRQEAKFDIELDVEFPSTDVERAMWALYEAYRTDLDLGTPFVPANQVNPATSQWRVETSYVESVLKSDAYVISGGFDTQTGSIRVDRDGWEELI